MNATTVRMILAAGIVLYVLTDGRIPWDLLAGGGSSGGPYAGPLSTLHAAAASMDPKDRAVLSEAMAAAGEMLEADRLGLVTTTEELQRYVRAVTEFDYVGIGKPTQKYPAVAKAFQAELEKAVGTDVAPVTPAIRSAVVAALAEASKATR
jgi:hypothetical protein